MMSSTAGAGFHLHSRGWGRRMSRPSILPHFPSPIITLITSSKRGFKRMTVRQAPGNEEAKLAMSVRARFAEYKLRGVSTHGKEASLFSGIAAEVDQSKDRSFISEYDAYNVLAHVLDHRGWDEREGQVQMVEHIGDGRDMLISAPVGIGKTLGYLIPSLLHNVQTMVATSTKALQDQIAYQEMPRLANDLEEIYGFRPTWTILKGKSNYLDEDRLNTFLGLPPMAKESLEWDAEKEEMVRAEIARLMELEASGRGCGFDSEGLATKLGPNLWRHLCATSSRSHWFNRTLERAYGHSNLIITNAAYVVSVCNLGLERYPLIGLPQAIIFDEAHHLPDIVTESLTANFDPKALLAGAENLTMMAKNIGPNTLSAWGDLVDGINRAYKKLQRVRSDEAGRQDLHDIARSLYQAVCAVSDEAIGESSASPQDGTLVEVGQDFSARATDEYSYSHYCDQNKYLSFVALQEFAEEMKLLRLADASLAITKDRMGNDVFSYFMSVEDRDVVGPNGRKTGQTYRTAGLSPIYTQQFGEMARKGLSGYGIERKAVELMIRSGKDADRYDYILPPSGRGETTDQVTRQVCLVSGTISNGVQITLGLSSAKYAQMSSPFDPERCRFYIPNDIPTPKESSWQSAIPARVCSLVESAGGRALVITNSYASMKVLAEAISLQFPDKLVLVQGEKGKNELIEAFRADESSILVGTKGFWEGVDVPGPACSLVIMDKIPFPVPTSAVKAREEYVRQTQGERLVFTAVSVLDASQMLAQGAGRLIRSEGDIGGVAILDPRLASTGYGKRVMSLLSPGTQYTTDLNEFSSWMNYVNPDNPRSNFSPTPGKWTDTVPPKRKLRSFG